MKNKSFLIIAIILVGFTVAALFLMRKGEERTDAPGSAKTFKTKALETGAELIQNKGPINAIHQHVCGFHFYADDIKRQVRADHYCSHLSEEVLQCVIYDSDRKDARLIGIEYIISEALFKQLPEEEKKLWHSHRYEVKSGLLIAPGIPTAAEKEVMKKLVTTYGKTWHTWQVDRGDKLPLGLPKLMMGFTGDGQISTALVKQRDKEIGVNTEEKREEREDIPVSVIAEGADAWEKNGTIQINDDLLEPGKNPVP